MNISEAIVGMRVRSLVDFSGVPKGTEGIIDEDYGSGVMVAWDLPGRPLPKGYREVVEDVLRDRAILRDGFDKKTELHFLETVSSLRQPGCTCRDDCPTACKGECGCEVCHNAYADFLASE